VCKEHNKGSLCLSVLLHSRWCLILQFPSSHGKAGVPFPPERRAIDIGDYYSDFSLIQNELGWRPGTDLRSGLARTIEYFVENRLHYWDTAAT